MINGTNNPEKYDNLIERTDNKVHVRSFKDSAKFSEIILLPTKGNPREKILKTIFDTTYPIANVPPRNGLIKYITPHDESLMERLQKLEPEAHFVKSFSCIGSALMVNHNFNGAMFITSL